MDFKNLLINARNIVLYKIIETIGIGIIILGLLFFLSLITYSPNDPNFIFSENKEIKNLLGFKGSLVSDFFFSSNRLGFFFNPFIYSHYRCECFF